MSCQDSVSDISSSIFRILQHKRQVVDHCLILFENIFGPSCHEPVKREMGYGARCVPAGPLPRVRQHAEGLLAVPEGAQVRQHVVPVPVQRVRRVVKASMGNPRRKGFARGPRCIAISPSLSPLRVGHPHQLDALERAPRRFCQEDHARLAHCPRIYRLADR